MLVNYKKIFRCNDDGSLINEISFYEARDSQLHLYLSVPESIINQVRDSLARNTPNLLCPHHFFTKMRISAPQTEKSGLISALMKLRDEKYISADFVDEIKTFIDSYRGYRHARLGSMGFLGSSLADYLNSRTRDQRYRTLGKTPFVKEYHARPSLSSVTSLINLMRDNASSSSQPIILEYRNHEVRGIEITPRLLRDHFNDFMAPHSFVINDTPGAFDFTTTTGAGEAEASQPNAQTQLIPAQHSYSNFQQTLFSHYQDMTKNNDYELVENSDDEYELVDTEISVTSVTKKRK